MKIVSASRLAALVLALLLSGCESWVYKIDVQQGNILDAGAVDKLKVGMDKAQVRFLLGSPAVTDIFHTRRWDYVYYLKPGRGAAKLEGLSVFFDGDRVIRLERRPLDGEASKG